MVDAYILVFAGLLLTMGALGDRFGRKLAFNAGLLVFAAASAASTLAGSPEILIAARAAMGIGAALIMPATLSIITNIFPPSERGRAIGIWTGMAGLGIIQAPEQGGTDPLILDAFSVAAVLSAAFIWWERRVQHPMLPDGVLRQPPLQRRQPRHRHGVPCAVRLGVPPTQHLQFVLGYTPLQAGVRVLPVAALIVAAPLTERIGTKLVVAAGLLGRAVRSGSGYGRLRGRGGR
jgi:hypothetical protein